MKVELAKYPTYKPSGVEWIREIPVGWHVRHLKMAVRRITTGMTPSDDLFDDEGSICWFSPGDFRGEMVLNSSKKKLREDAFSKGVRRFPPNSVLIVGIGATLGKVAYSEIESTGNQQINCIVTNDVAKGRFIALYLSVMTEVIRIHANTSTLGIINQAQTGAIRIPVPCTTEQEYILSFLDRETAKIDRLLAVRAKQVDLLQEQRGAVIHHAVTKGIDPTVTMKPSGIPWLPSIPNTWSTHRLRRTTTRETNGFWGDDPNGDESDIVCIRVADFDRQKRVVRDGEKTLRSVPESKRGKRLLSSGDLLLEKAGGGEKTPVGCVVRYIGDELAISSNFIAKLTPLVNYDSNFLCYLHQALYDAGIAMLSVKQTTGIQNLDAFWYLNELAPFPPKEEQLRIAAYIDDEVSKIDALAAKYRRELDLLAEYRASLISHAVTGKIDVRGLVSPSELEAT